jgi:hypothetical protein
VSLRRPNALAIIDFFDRGWRINPRGVGRQRRHGVDEQVIWSHPAVQPGRQVAEEGPAGEVLAERGSPHLSTVELRSNTVAGNRALNFTMGRANPGQTNSTS